MVLALLSGTCLTVVDLGDTNEFIKVYQLTRYTLSVLMLFSKYSTKSIDLPSTCSFFRDAVVFVQRRTSSIKDNSARLSKEKALSSFDHDVYKFN